MEIDNNVKYYFLLDPKVKSEAEEIQHKAKKTSKKKGTNPKSMARKHMKK